MLSQLKEEVLLALQLLEEQTLISRRDYHRLYTYAQSHPQLNSLISTLDLSQDLPKLVSPLTALAKIQAPQFKEIQLKRLQNALKKFLRISLGQSSHSEDELLLLLARSLGIKSFTLHKSRLTSNKSTLYRSAHRQLLLLQQELAPPQAPLEFHIITKQGQQTTVCFHQVNDSKVLKVELTIQNGTLSNQLQKLPVCLLHSLLGELFVRTFSIVKSIKQQNLQLAAFKKQVFDLLPLILKIQGFLQFVKLIRESMTNLDIKNVTALTDNCLLRPVWMFIDSQVTQLCNAASTFKTSLNELQTSVVFIDQKGNVFFCNKLPKTKIKDIREQSLHYSSFFTEFQELKGLIGKALQDQFYTNSIIRSHNFNVQLYIKDDPLAFATVYINKIKKKSKNFAQPKQFSQISSQDSTKGPRLKSKKSKDKGLQGNWLSMWIKNQPQQGSSKEVAYQVQKQQQGSDEFKHLQKQLSELDISSFDLNVLQFENNSRRFSLPIKIFRQRNFLKTFRVSLPSIVNFLSVLETHYNLHSNPFHNYIHGINVMYSAHLISLQTATQLPFLDELSQLTLILSALCHDVGHTGRTNQFEINSGSALAQLYNDRSPLQNMHASKSFQIFSELELFSNLQKKRQVYLTFRQRFISNILYTDITQHFPLLNSFIARHKQPDFGQAKDDLSIVSGIIIHASDFAGSVKEFGIAKEWSFRVNKQFQQQYKQQGLLGIPQTPFLKDLHILQVLSKGQAGFLKVIVRPLYKQLNDSLSNVLSQQLKFLDESISSWEAITAQEQTKRLNRKIEQVNEEDQ